MSVVCILLSAAATINYIALYIRQPTISCGVQVKNWIWKMRAEGKAFCSDNWYLLAGVLLQKRRPSLPSKRKASMSPDSHTNGVGASNGGTGLSSHPELLNVSSNGHSSNGHSTNGHSVSGHTANGHSANGHTFSSDDSESEGPQQDGLGDCSGLRHRYSTDANGAVNAAEDQLDELIQVMTALR